MNKRPEEYWYVHGEAYDLSSFCEVHPGGKEQLMVAKGRDCTEMVHCMHALASMDKVKQILDKYRVGTSKEEHSELFVWKEEGLYGVLKKRVNDYFKGLAPKDNPKSDTKFWVITFLEVALQAMLVYWWLYGASYLSAFVAGLITISLGFMVAHTAGHCGISKKGKVNNFWYQLSMNYLLGFSSKVWDLHHNYGHHCYTNIHKKDPDVSNALAVVRKSQHQALKPQHKAQWYTAYILLVFFPNQWFGQVIQYYFSTKRRKIFGLPMIHKEESSLKQIHIFFAMILGFSIILYLKQGLLFTLISLYLYSSGCGFAYWACVFPNHDTDLAEQSSIDEVMSKESDWGEHQIRHSSNFKVPDWFSYFIGGMNYQTEHHLFPTVHPRHYPEIAKMVKEECEKRGVQYCVHDSWFSALLSNFRHLKKMSKDKKE